jgi:hypothetical protein
MKKLLILSILVSSLMACKSDSGTAEQAATSIPSDTVQVESGVQTKLAPMPAKEGAVFNLTAAPVFKSKEATDFVKEYDAFMSSYWEAMSKSKQQSLSGLTDKLLELSAKSANVIKGLSGDDLSNFKQYLAARQKEYSAMVSGANPN